MSRIIKRKWKNIRKDFKNDILQECTNNKAFAVMIVETYVARQSIRHIHKIWYLLGRYHKEAYKDYNEKLIGKALASNDEILRNLYFINKELYNKYHNKLPECYALGTAYGTALKVLNSKNGYPTNNRENKNRKFIVIDSLTGQEADIKQIVLKEKWANGLVYCDMEGFYIGPEGNLILADENSSYTNCDTERFKVQWV